MSATAAGGRVLVLCLHLQRHLDRYREIFAHHRLEVEAPPVEQHMREAELLRIIHRFDGVVAGDDELTARVLEAGAPRLRVVAKWGVGVDGIDREAARRLGITVSNTPDVFAAEVGDVTIGYLIVLARRLHEIDRSVRAGGWFKPQGLSLQGRRLGVVGVGSIGRAVAVRGRALGMEVAGFDVAGVDEGLQRLHQVEETSLDGLLSTSDFVSLNCPLTRDTLHLIDRAALAHMKPGSFLVNTARGPLVDEAALAEALRSGHLAGAALDVFEQEPLSADSPLRELDNVVFGSHNASNTLEAVLRVNEMAVTNLLRGLGLDPA